MASLAVLVCSYFPPSVSKFPRLLPFFFFYFCFLSFYPLTVALFVSNFPPFSVSKEPSLVKKILLPLYSAFFPCLSHSFPIFSISPPSPLHAGVESLFIGPRERGLFIAVHGSRAAPGWLVGAAGRARRP